MEESLKKFNYDDVDKSVIISNISLLLNNVASACTSEVINKLNYREITLVSFEINNLCNDLKTIDLREIPEPILQEIIFPQIKQIFEFYENFFDDKAANIYTIEARKQIYFDSLKLYTEAYNLLTPIVSYYKTKNINLDGKKIEENFNLLFEKFQSEQEAFISRGNEIEEKQRLLLEQSEKLTENLGISSYAKYFQDEAVNHNDKSQLWVIITFSIAVATILFAIGGHIYLPDIPGDTLTPKYVSQVLAPKATVLAILIYMLTWSVKNQKSHNHNYIVNKHRKNALETFQAFVLSSEGTPEIKHAMLMQMTNCIFNHQNSSYTVTEKEPDIANKLLDLVKPSAKGS